MESFFFRDYVKVLLRRWLMIVILIVLAVSATGCFSFYILKPKYQASVTLLVEIPQVNNQIGYDQLRANQILLRTYEEIIRSRNITEDVIKKLDLQMTSEEFLKKITVASPADSLITSIQVTDEDPQKAIRIADEIAHSFSSNLGSIMNVRNVSILNQAQLDSEKPVSPKPYLNMTIAFILSLCAGCAIALFFEMFDTTIKEQAQIDAVLKLPVLGVIPEIKSKKMKNARQKERSFLMEERGRQNETSESACQVNMPS
ncbi:YveK family protein [Brevibacillus fluminis]|uniref:YveK family protein n=1 Tax=Brevibacillus fluminis TaxID=511487 RepID=UPI003F8C2A48